MIIKHNMFESRMKHKVNKHVQSTLILSRNNYGGENKEMSMSCNINVNQVIISTTTDKAME